MFRFNSPKLPTGLCLLRFLVLTLKFFAATYESKTRHRTGKAATYLRCGWNCYISNRLRS